MPEKELDKNGVFNEFINRPIEINNSEYHSYFISIINGSAFGTELENTKYNLIEAKFILFLYELSKLDDCDYKFDAIGNLIYSIKVTRLLDENLPNILNSLDKIEDSCEKRNIYEIIVDSIQIARLLEKNFSILLDSLEKIEDVIEREFGFETLLFSIRGTRLLAENFTSILYTLDKLGDIEAKRSAFYELTSTVGETNLSEEIITDLLNFLDKFSGNHKILTFCDIISSIKHSFLLEEEKIAKYSLLKTNFPDILNVINMMDDDIEKRRALCNLMFEIKKTTLIEENFNTILNTIDNIIDDTHKRYSLSYVISAIREEQSFNEKLTLIKERFPKYSDELVEILNKKENS